MNNKTNMLAVTKQQCVGITPINTMGFLYFWCCHALVGEGVDKQLQVVQSAIHQAAAADHTFIPDPWQPCTSMTAVSAEVFSFAVATGKELGVRSFNVARLARGNVFSSARSARCKDLFITHAEDESSPKGQS